MSIPRSSLRPKSKAKCGAIDTVVAIVLICGFLSLLRYVLH